MRDPAVDHLVNVLVEDQRTRWSGGLERFLVTLASTAGADAFREWREHPTTQLFLGAMKSLSETVANDAKTDAISLALAHGTISGINLAVRLVDDPTRVFPSIFDGAESLMGRRAAAPIGETYARPDGVEGQEDGN